MLKVVAWLVLIFLVLFALRMINVRKTRSRNRAATSAPATEAQAMVRCARCGVFLPRSEANPVLSKAPASSLVNPSAATNTGTDSIGATGAPLRPLAFPLRPQ